LRLIEKSDLLTEKLADWYTESAENRVDMGAIEGYELDWVEVKTHLDHYYSDPTRQLIGAETDKGNIVGSFFLDDLCPVRKRAFTHVFFPKESRGKGLVESYNLFLDYCFITKGLENLYAHTPEYNKKCVHFVNRFGWVQKGELPGYYLYEGKPQKALVMCLNKNTRRR